MARREGTVGEGKMDTKHRKNEKRGKKVERKEKEHGLEKDKKKTRKEAKGENILEAN